MVLDSSPLSTMSSIMSAAATATSAASSSSQPTQYRPVGIALAIGSGVLIGSSFVFKKKGLLQSQAGHAAGEGVAYLKSVCATLHLVSVTSSDFLTSRCGGQA